MNEHRVIELASWIADGNQVDWELAEREAGDGEHGDVVRRLRLVASVADVHRSLTEESDADVAASPRSWGPLEILGKLGEGGFGKVYLAHDARIDREVALKLLRACDAGVIDEGRLLAKVRHPNVITVFGADIHDGRAGIWMERVKGQTLGELVRDRGKLGAREAAAIGVELCQALAAIHAAGLVHRDVKAQNVMRAEGGRIVLMDFNSSRDLAGADEVLEGNPGTPLYMAPEIFRDEDATAQSDIYSLGVLLYYLVTGTYPAFGASMDKLVELHRRRDYKSLRDARPDLPTDFVRVVERALAAEPHDRFATPGAMETALAETLGADRTPTGKRGRESRRWIGLAAGALALVLAGVWLAIEWRSASALDYTAFAALQRGTGERERLSSGGSISVGDSLSLDFEGSVPLFVYVISTDEAGNAWVLFPRAGSDLVNPLPGDRRHRLPGRDERGAAYWSVDTAGGRERMLIVASPDRLIDFEAEIAKLPATGVPLDRQAQAVLTRGIGGIVHGTDPSEAGGLAAIFDQASELADRAEETRGVWVRWFELLNPLPEKIE